MSGDAGRWSHVVLSARCACPACVTPAETILATPLWVPTLDPVRRVDPLTVPANVVLEPQIWWPK